MEGIKDTSTISLRKILGNGLTYLVPKFQRDYSWETEHWDDLWLDMIDLYNDVETSHYMGYLVFQTSDNKLHKIIDGQQRLTTISLLIISILKRLKELEETGIDAEKNKLRREQLQNSYIGFIDPVTLIAKNKLELNRNNDDFYKHYIVPLANLPQRGRNASEKLMKACFEWFYKKTTSLYKTGEELTRFIEKIVDKLFFTVITVGDELNAYKVFETLNARGVKLSTADLLKNYLFSIVDSNEKETRKEEFELLEYLWSELLRKLGSEKLPEYIRYYWNSKNKTVRKNDLFKTLKSNIKDKANVFALLRDLVEKADIFVAILSPEDEYWNNHTLELRNSLRELKIFGAKQQISLLISGKSNLTDPKFTELVKYCSIVYMRYNIIGGLNPNEQEGIFNKLALDIQNNKDYNKSDFLEIYPSDEEFEVAFSNKEFTNTSRNNKVTKYILTKIENYISQADFDFQSDRNTIEHILPENPDDTWDIEDDVRNRCRYRLGNLTLLEKNKNSHLKNKSYDQKRIVFQNSKFAITKDIAADYSHWGEEEISRRQNILAKKAKTIWRISF